MTRLSYEALQAENSQLKELVVSLKAEIDTLKERLTAYEHRLKKSSRNSSKPPGSDGLGKPNAPKRGKGGRRSGGQPGHKGQTLIRSKHVDHVRHHHPASCAYCGGSLTGDQNATITKTRQVQDIPARRPLVITDHHVMACQCKNCGETTIGTFPADVKAPVQYGHHLQELVVYLAVSQLVPIRRIGQVIHTWTGTRLSEGTICNYIKSFAHRFEAVHTHLGELVKYALVTHFDETGMRVEGSLKWFHVGTTKAFCYFWLGQSRGDVMTQATGVAIHDFWKSYQKKMPDADHAYCLAHLVRECQGLTEMGEKWTAKLARLFYDMMKADQQGQLPSAKAIAAMEARFDRILKEGFEYHDQLDPLPQKSRGRPKRRPGHNLAHRLQDTREGTLLCLHNPLVDATNNLAERDLRPLKLKQKISGSFRSKDGARYYATLRSVLETARKQGWNALDTLGKEAAELIECLTSEEPIPDT